MTNIFKSFLGTALIASFALSAHAAELNEVFNGDMLDTNQRYFESVAGIPRESYGDKHIFRVQGCNITATMAGGTVSALRLELTERCQADLSSFIGGYAPAADQALSFGSFASAAGGVLDFSADCLSMCGNAYDPSTYALWEGPRAANFMQVLLEVELVGDKAIDASNRWEAAMTAQKGDDYVMDMRFNCENSFSAVANEAFKDVPVTAVTIGHWLEGASC